MALTPEGARLTELHRLLQVRLSAQSMAATRLHWATMNPAQGSRAMNDWLKRQVALSGVFDKQSAAAAADYVQKFRLAEGFPPGPVVGVQDYDPKWAAESMSYNGSNKVGLLMDQGVGAKEALARVAPNALAAAQRLTLGGGRRVVDQSALANPDSNGWRRVTDGNACSFCAMLVARGNAYRSEKSAGVGRHWHKRCGCSVEEVFGDWTPTAKEQQYVDAYESAVKDLGAEDRVSNQTNVLEKMRAQGGFNDSPKPKVVEPSRESIQIAPKTGAEKLLSSWNDGHQLQRELTGGAVALRVELHELKDGSKVVLKESKKVTETTREVVAGKIASALGIDKTNVVSLDANTSIAPFLEGKLGAMVSQEREWAGEERLSALRSQVVLKNGKEMGLLDFLIDNPDRHAGNWIVSSDGLSVNPLDHGLARFGVDPGPPGFIGNGPFADYWVGGREFGSSLGIPVDASKLNPRFSAAELDDISSHLAGIRRTATPDELQFLSGPEERLAVLRKAALE